MRGRLATIAAAVAAKHNLNPSVVMAICEVESGWDTYAVRYEPQWKYILEPALWSKKVETSAATEKVLQSCSWGLMQVMGTVARELGFSEDFPRLCLPEVGIQYGCLKLVDCLKKYPQLPDALASYNAGNPKYPAGKLYAGKILAKLDAVQS
jgi:soluble lytic murein transglycosylase-like protein